MDYLTESHVAELLIDLHQQADASDGPMKEQILAAVAASGKSFEAFFAEKIAEDKSDFKVGLGGHRERFLAVSPTFGRFLYMCARVSRARRIVEFGSSMGVSTIYLAAALKDNGGGQLIGSEIEPSKVARARANIKIAGLAELVDIREGDAMDTLWDVGGHVDLLMLDGAFSLYLPILKLIEPRLKVGALVVAENALDFDYLNYVRDPSNGYSSMSVALDEPRGNEFTVRTS